MNKNLIIILLAIISLGGVGYIIYDNIKKDDTNNVVDNNSDNDEAIQEENSNIVNVIASGYLLDLINDESKIEDSKEYKNVTFNVGDLNLTFNCTGFGDPVGNYCYSGEVSINENVINSYSNVSGKVNDNPYIIITDKHLIVQKTDSYIINIYDKSGNELLSVENVVYAYDDGEDYYTEVPMYLQNGKLYFLTFVKDDTDFQTEKQISSKYIELSDSSFKLNDNNNTFSAKVACREC